MEKSSTSGMAERFHPKPQVRGVESQVGVQLLWKVHREVNHTERGRLR